MRINPINFYNSYYKPAFKSDDEEFRNKKTGEIYNRSVTSFFRNDLECDNLTDFIINEYKNTDRVNLYCFGCSDGSEPYSIAITLIEKLGEEKAQKFFPIKAYDINPKSIDKALSGYIKMDFLDEEMINAYTDDNLQKYFGPRKIVKGQDSYIPDFIREVKPILKGAVEFNIGDIREKVKDIKKENSVILSRNFWPYLGIYTERSKVLRQLWNQIDNNSVVIIGQYDKEGESRKVESSDNTEFVLGYCGFKPIDSYIFKKTLYPDILHTAGKNHKIAYDFIDII